MLAFSADDKESDVNLELDGCELVDQAFQSLVRSSFSTKSDDVQGERDAEIQLPM